MDGAGVLGGFLFFLFFLALYLIPTIIAVIRQVPNMGSVIVINVFLGWTFIGWVVAVAMAARSVPAVQQVIVNTGQQMPRSPSSPP